MSENTATKTLHDDNGEAKIDENDIIIKSMQELRTGFIKQLSPDGKFPSDKDDRDALMTLITSSTNAALGAKKIKSAEKTATSQLQLVHSLAEAVRIQRSQASANNRESIKQKREVPKVDVKLVPGNTDIGSHPINTTSIANGGDGKIHT